MFNAIDIAGSGLQASHTWLDVIADNIANVNDVTTTNGQAFRAKYVQAQAATGGRGVEITGITEAPGNGDLTHEPNNPLADANGDVRHADVDLAGQLGDLIAAQRAFQADANVVDRAKETYEAAIGIGKGV